MFHWSLTRWGQALISVVAVHMTLRMLIGLLLNIGLMVHRSAAATSATDI